MKRISTLAFAAAAHVLAVLPATAASYDTFRLDEMPDFTQTDPALGLPNGGRMYCAPVAAANALVWLAERRGFARLLPVRGLSTTEKVSTVAKTLGHGDFMSTAPKGGTTPEKFLVGLENYAESAGYRANLDYRGRWKMPSRFGGGQDIPDLDWITGEFDDGHAIWLAIGFYEPGKLPGEYRRIGGHMVTVAGYGVGPDGAPDRDTVILHDSDDGGGTQIQRVYLTTEEIRQGDFVDRNGRKLARADGHLMATGGYRLRRGIVAIIDSAISLGL